jgi:hypothetical protein
MLEFKTCCKLFDKKIKIELFLTTVKYTVKYRQIYNSQKNVPSNIQSSTVKNTQKKKKKHSTTKYTSFSRYREKYKKVPWEICDPSQYTHFSKPYIYNFWCLNCIFVFRRPTDKCCSGASRVNAEQREQFYFVMI